MRPIQACLVLLIAGFALADQAAAQFSPRFICESRHQGVQYCDVDTRDGVVLVRQLSRAPCLEGRSWGWDHRGIWVSHGCGAEFETGRDRWHRGDPGWGDDGWRDGGPHFTCESRGQRTVWCRVDTFGGVVLLRQLSRSRCVEGQTWGWDRRGVWVSQGCRAEFFAGGGGWGRGPDWSRPDGRDRRIRCESFDGRTRWCDIGHVRDLRFHRQISRSPCIEGSTWGWDHRGLWVSQGCRAEFSVW